MNGAIPAWHLRIFTEPVRALVSLTVIGTACWMALHGQVSPDAFMGMVGLVVGWWFRRRGDQDKKEPAP